MNAGADGTFCYPPRRVHTFPRPAGGFRQRMPLPGDSPAAQPRRPPHGDGGWGQDADDYDGYDERGGRECLLADGGWQMAGGTCYDGCLYPSTFIIPCSLFIIQMADGSWQMAGRTS